MNKKFPNREPIVTQLFLDLTLVPYKEKKISMMGLTYKLWQVILNELMKAQTFGVICEAAMLIFVRTSNLKWLKVTSLLGCQLLVGTCKRRSGGNIIGSSSIPKGGHSLNASVICPEVINFRGLLWTGRHWKIYISW